MSPSTGPLVGIRVLELAGIGPVPLAGMLLSDMGADVLRIDRPGGVGLVPVPPEADAMARGRRSAIVDLHQPAGVSTVLSLVERTDILLEGHRPGTTERLGIGPNECFTRNPRLIYGRMTGWGQEGPLARTAGHDINYIALTGALHAVGEADRPSLPLNVLGDFGGGSTYLVMGLLAALLEAGRSGRGQVVDAAIIDGVSSLMTMTYSMHSEGRWIDRRRVNMLDGGLPWYDVYATSDDRHVAVGALEDRFFAELVTKLGLSPAEASRQPHNHDALRRKLTEIFRSRTRDEWAAFFEGTDACVSPVLSLTEAPTHPHNAFRRTYLTMNHRLQPAPAPRFSRTPSRVAGAPPLPGADTGEALADWGIDNVTELLASRVIYQH